MILNDEEIDTLKDMFELVNSGQVKVNLEIKGRHPEMVMVFTDVLTQRYMGSFTVLIEEEE